MLLFSTSNRKHVAAFLTLVMLTDIFIPVCSYGLTSGPTAPEATSFEPIDTTDMVNLQTGEFTYNMPLLEVPGPEGGYPLSLSYHAGIQPNEDASWVGLGWTLNPGAVSRNVNGYPDDWYNPQNNSHVYMEEGVTKTYNVGVNIGIANTPATVGVDLSFSQDTYRGFGVGGSVSIGKSWKLGKIANIGASIGIGISPYGSDAYVFGGVGVGIGLSEKLGASVGIGFSTNFESVNAGASGGIDYSLAQSKKNRHHGFKGSLLRASISTGGGKPSLSAAGITSSVSASEEAEVEYDRSSFSIDVPVYYFNVSLGYSKTRYWIDKSTNVYTHGSIYGSGWGEISETIGGNSMTNMVAYDRAFDTYALLEDPDEKNIVDNPDPNRVQGGAYPDFDDYRVVAQGLGGSMRPYLFQGEVLGQNRKKADGSRSVNYYSPGATNTTPQFRFDGDFSNSYRQNFNAYSNPALNLRLVAPPFATPVYGDGDGSYGYSGGKLAGTKHIDIGPAIKPSNPKGYNKADRYLSNMIEGFSITNESGVTYHYGLPAYSWGEENYQEKVKNSGFNKVYFNRGTKATPYAYTWYLTTVTGPDFVDRNSNGIADGNDWGYWVNFEYGKWSNNYVWRNPSEGYHRDVDNEFQTCSMGTKEVYYLNAIRTRSHIALFEKDIRLDGKGASPSVFSKNTKQDYMYAGLFNGSSAQSLRLDKIYLLNASDSLFVLPSSGNNNAYSPNVLDKTDVDAVNRYALEDKAIRIIDFSYDYSLCPYTANSFNINTPTEKSGKLTLKNILFRGKGGSSLIPPVRLEYELPGTSRVVQNSVTMSTTNFTTNNANFQVGDMVESLVGHMNYGVITGKAGPSGGIYTYSLANNAYSGGTTTAHIQTTKNPDYNKDRFDHWGLYKSDADTATIRENENKGRVTTDISGKMTDAWSLRRIISSTGSIIDIEYESKVYKSVLNSIVGLDVVINNSVDGFVELYFPDINDFVYASSYFAINSKISFVALYTMLLPSIGKVMDTRVSFPNMKVTSVPLVATIIKTNIPYATYSDSLNTYNDFRVANVFCGRQDYKTGGGIRVKQLTINDNAGSIYSTTYNYKDPATGKESGVSSYEPNLLDVRSFPGGISEDAKKKYKARLYYEMNSLLRISREIPPPGVIHEYVRVTSGVKNSSESAARTVAGGVQYQFEVFRENMIYRNTRETPYTHHEITQGTIDSRNISVKKFLHSLGEIKRKIQYDKDGKKLSETINHFLHDGLENLSDSLFFVNYKGRLSSYNYLGHAYDVKYQGLIQERYSEVKTVDEQGWTSASQVKATLSAREDYPCVPLGQTVINYVNGAQTTSQTLGFDFYNGMPVKSVETDAYGNRFMTETTPAYRKYSSMGVKVGTSSNKHMLTQTTATAVYKVNASNTKLGLASAGAEVWSNSVPSLDMAGAQVVQSGGSNGNVWRLKSSYLWMPVNATTDGLTPTGSFSEFNFATPGSSHANWKKTSEITLNDVYSKALEGADINNNYTATRLNHQSRKVELSGAPAKYYEIAFSGAEDDNLSQTANGFVKKADGTVASAAGVAHTGSKSLKLGTSGKKGFIYTIECNKLTPGRDYMASVWVKPVSGSASDVKLYYDKGGAALGNSISSGASTKTAGSWKLINLKINGSDITAGATVNIGCRNDHATVEAYVDDFRFQPLNAGTTAYVYDSFSGELTHMLDNSNLYTRFEYDAAGRLTAVYWEKLGVGEYRTSEYQQNFSAPRYTSSLSSYIASRDNCPAGYTTTPITVPIPAGRFVSYTSVADANQQAIAYAQAEANRLGVCTSPSNLQLRNNIAADADYYTDALLNQVQFRQSGVLKYTFTWPTGPGSREASAFVNVAPGDYTLDFDVLVGEPETARYYGFKQSSGGTITKWTRSNSNEHYGPTSTITVSAGTNYTLTVASKSSLNN
ncbi:MAG: DUF3575 domain-containing protein [Chitinophagaceae bacterium]|nr:DUF3575 domain-containing protein [Chitinophagaceae bacterium]